MCAAKIFGVEILNERSGISIDDAVTEMSATFVARTVETMSAVPSPFQPRDFRLLPCLGAFEKRYRLCPALLPISLSMSCLRSTCCGHCFRLLHHFGPGLPQAPNNCATPCATRFLPAPETAPPASGIVSVSIPGVRLLFVLQQRRKSHSIDPSH
jgi:hypothetical protein